MLSPSCNSRTAATVVPRSISRTTVAAIVALGVVALTGLPAQAFTYAETGDAGQTPGTAAATGGTQSITLNSASSITGSIVSLNDADAFSFTLSGTATLRFVTTTVSSTYGVGQLDTELFLFSSTGAPILANDDANGTTVQSQLTVTLAAGTYYIAVSLSGNDPINSSSQLVFATSANTTTTRGPASGLNPATWSTFNSGNSLADTGTYTIGITTVPEPRSWMLTALGATAVCFAMARRKRRTNSKLQGASHAV